jgi:hypothetical protein
LPQVAVSRRILLECDLIEREVSKRHFHPPPGGLLDLMIDLLDGTHCIPATPRSRHHRDRWSVIAPVSVTLFMGPSRRTECRMLLRFALAVLPHS